jgi:spore coat protein U-like protein
MPSLTSRITACAFLGLALAWAAPSAAQSPGAACTLSVPELSFGVYDVFAANRTRAVGRIQVDCGLAVSRIRPRIELSAGSSQDFSARTQRSGSNVLIYNIYADEALTQVVGDGSSGTTVLFLESPSGGELTLRKANLYGAISAGQFTPPGVYFDTVYVTLIF